jgi:hypothetical protein
VVVLVMVAHLTPDKVFLDRVILAGLALELQAQQGTVVVAAEPEQLV